MRVLNLDGNKLDGSACDLLAKVVPSMSRLVELWLSFNPLGNGGAVEVINALCGSRVKQLSLSITEIEEPDCEGLCELLKSSHSNTLTFTRSEQLVLRECSQHNHWTQSQQFYDRPECFKL